MQVQIIKKEDLPGSSGIPEVLHPDAWRGGEHRVGVVHLGPLEEQRVREVRGHCQVLDLDGPVRGSGVEHHDAAVVEDRGGAGPDAVDVVPAVRNHGQGEVVPVEEVLGHGMPPCYVAPHRAVGIVLVEEMVPTVVVHWTCDQNYELDGHSKK